MKKALGLAVLMLFVGATSAMAQGKLTITSTPHDLSGETYTDEVCNVCHTPHDADLTLTAAPLWNHEVTAATFTPYSSATLDATVGDPGDISMLCLSCHDGTVAMDNYGGTTTGTDYIAPGRDVGTDLSDDHPVGFTYDLTLATADGELADPSTDLSGLGGTIAADMLFGDQLECASCHDVHDNTNDNFLLMVNTGSALCLTCHGQ